MSDSMRACCLAEGLLLALQLDWEHQECQVHLWVPWMQVTGVEVSVDTNVRLPSNVLQCDWSELVLGGCPCRVTQNSVWYSSDSTGLSMLNVNVYDNTIKDWGLLSLMFAKLHLTHHETSRTTSPEQVTKEMFGNESAPRLVKTNHIHISTNTSWWLLSERWRLGS